MPQISVVVPVYKVENYIRRCIDSILQQTFSDFELILVDDGSPDRCGAICDEYSLRDSRIHVIHQQNGGLSAARNAAIEWMLANSESQWLTFVDSDDWLHDRMLEKLWQAAVQLDAQISICGYLETRDDHPDVPETIPEPETWNPADFYVKRHVNATIACGKLYARSLFQTTRYPQGRIHEDEFVTYRLLFACDRLAVVAAPLYFYYMNAEGITKSSWTPKRLDALAAKEEQLRFFKEEENPAMYRFCLRNYLETALLHLKEMDQLPDTADLRSHRKEMDRKIKSLIRENNQHGQIHIWNDYECLCRYYPVPVQMYRLYNSLRKRLGLKYDE